MHRDDDALPMDLLVEGELGELERRRLLARLDHTPDGWKRLATAFLEAQAWRAALADDVRPTIAAAPSAAPRDARRQWARWSALALGLALAFLGGWALKGGAAPSAPVIALAAPTPATRRVGELVWNGGPAMDEAGVPARRITVYENPDPQGAWLAALPPLVTSYSAGRLERMGCGVAESRDVLPVALGDGRRLAVLVEDVQLRLKGRLPTL